MLVIVAWLGIAELPCPAPTAKIAVPTLLLLSIAVTVTLPAKPPGTDMYAMNEPVALDVRAAGTVVTIIPPTWITIGELAVKSLPIICTVVPIAAVFGVSIIVGVVKVNVAIAVFPAASVIVKLFVASAVSGIVNVAAEIAPEAVVVAALRATTWPLILAVIALDAANPVADALSVVPFAPEVGVIVIAGVTVIADWTSRPVPKSVTVSR